MKTIHRNLLPTGLRRLTKKHTAYVSTLMEGEGVSTFGSWWDGGSKNTFTAYRIATGEHTPLSVMREVGVSSNPPQHGGEVQTILPPKGWAIVVGGWSSGKTAHLHVHVRKDDEADFAGVKDCPPLLTYALHDWLLDCGRAEEADKLRALYSF